MLNPYLTYLSPVAYTLVCVVFSILNLVFCWINSRDGWVLVLFDGLLVGLLCVLVGILSLTYRYGFYFIVSVARYVPRILLCLYLCDVCDLTLFPFWRMNKIFSHSGG